MATVSAPARIVTGCDDSFTSIFTLLSLTVIPTVGGVLSLAGTITKFAGAVLHPEAENSNVMIKMLITLLYMPVIICLLVFTSLRCILKICVAMVFIFRYVYCFFFDFKQNACTSEGFLYCAWAKTSLNLLIFMLK